MDGFNAILPNCSFLYTTQVSLHKLATPLKTTEDIEEAVKLFNDNIQWAGWTATPNSTAPLHTHDCPTFIKYKLEEK
jgi:hypothetical protein